MPESPEVVMGRLDERLKGLEKKTDEHHQIVMTELKEIRDNINPRLTSVEQRMYTKSEFTTFYKEYVVKEDSQDKDIKAINSWKNQIIGGLIILNIILGLAVAYYSTTH